MEQRCFYEILEIPRNADIATIKKAYKRLALTWHPDKNPDNKDEAETMFKLISQAYEVISDENKRQIYDKYGHEGLNNGNSHHNHESDDEFDVFDIHNLFSFRDPNDIFREFFGTDPFENIFGMSSPFTGPILGPSIFDEMRSNSSRPRRNNHHHFHHHHHHHHRQPRANRHVQPYTINNNNNNNESGIQYHHHLQQTNPHHHHHQHHITTPFMTPLSSLFSTPSLATGFMQPSLFSDPFSIFSDMHSFPNTGNSIRISTSGFGGGSENFRSTSTSTKIINGRRVKTTKIVENGVETVTEEIDGVIVNKTVNGQSVAVSN